MAEKYGTIPPRFTRAWFDYVWLYYKWHILIPVFVIVFTVITLYQCTHKTQYDAEVIFAGFKYFTDENQQSITDTFAEYIEDINDDGETNVFFDQINFSGDAASAEMDYNLQMKLDLQYQLGETFLFIFDEQESEIMLNREDMDLIYLPVSEWADTMPDENKLYTNDGVAYAVSLADSQKAKELGLDSSYLTIKLENPNKDIEIARQSNAIRIANALLKD